MVDRIVGSSLKFSKAVVLAAVVVIAFGVWQLNTAKVETLPEFGPPIVEVQTEALGLAAEEVEQLITVPLEQDLLDGVAWLDTIHSRSVPGLSSIRMVFEPGTDLYRARQVVQERISQAAGLPNVSRPPQMLQPQSSLGRALMVSLSSKKITPLRIGVLARWTIRPRLLAVPGVASVAIWGQRERQIQVQVDPEKLAAANVTLEQVVSSTGNGLWVSPLTFLEASSPGTGGFIDSPNQRLGVQHNLPVVGPKGLAKIVIDETTGAPRTLGDVATIVEDHQPLIGDATVTGKRAGTAGLMLVVEKLPNANTSEVSEKIDAALDELRPGLSGLRVDSTVFRPASYVDRSVDNVATWTLIGLMVLAVALFALFFSWRMALVALSAIVLAYVTAALVLHLFGQTFTALLLVGFVLALVAVIDDAIATVARVAERLRSTDDGDPVATKPEIIRAAVLESGRTIIWAAIILAVALTPIFLMNGLSGDAFFGPVAVGALVAVVASLVVAVSVVPALSLLVLPAASLRPVSPMLDRIQAGYERLLAPVLARRAVAPAIGVVFVIVAALVVPGFRTSLLPELKDSDVMISWEAPFGTSLGEMARVTDRASAELRAVPGVRNVGAHVGQAIHGDQRVGSDSAVMWVSLAESADYDEVKSAAERIVAGYPGMRHRVSTYSQDRMREELGRTGTEVTVRVFGTDLDVLDAKARELRDLVADVDGVSTARVASRAAEPTMEVEVDLAKARDKGIKPGDVRRGAATLLSGLRVGNIFEDQKVFDVMVWSVPEARRSVSDVKNLLIDTPTGGRVRLGEVADVRVRSTLPVIEHQDVSRFADVAVDVRGRDAEDVATEVKDRLRSVKFPFEYHAELLGDYAQNHDAQQRTLGIAIAAAIAIFLLFQAAFSSWRLALIASLGVPVALSGGVVAAWLDGHTMTLATVAGLLAVFLVSVRSSLMLFDRLQRLRLDPGMALDDELIRRAARDQFVPTVASALVIALVLAAALLMGDVAGLEFVRAFAVVTLAGLVTATVTSLVVLPALYLHFGPSEAPVPFEPEPELEEADR